MKKTKQPKWHKRSNEGVCLNRDSLDLYIDGELVATQPINPNGLDILKGMVNEKMESGILFQIKIRDSVQWESVPTKADFEPNQFNYEVSVL